ncbi:DinB family protein [Paenibacillus taichungensis]|uniref:DinB family protein n=1 Tax=Paenibacillus taichungensis TaxID=484184 RepID=UPI0028714772|nr:DinB family protein [Paenibacillus taichungensis]MDR9744464.1 DinB family protein [Paenibacillus taichungensis]
MSIKLVLLDQLAACHHDKSWFVPLDEMLRDVTATQALSLNDEGQSIWRLVNHLTFWNETWLDRFIKGEVVMDNSIDNDETFIINPSQVSEEDWQKSIAHVGATFSRWIQAVEESDDAKLGMTIPSYFNAPWWNVISNLCIHNAYHIGQIMMLRKKVRGEMI